LPDIHLKGLTILYLTEDCQTWIINHIAL